MALGRPAPMLTSASPGRAAAMVPAPVERSQLPGHRQRSPNSAALTALTRFAALTRAREAGADSSELGQQTDLHWPAGRRCGCWPTSTFLFRGIGVGSFGGGRWSSGRSAPMLMSASPGRAAAMVPAPVERSELPAPPHRGVASPPSAKLTPWLGRRRRRRQPNSANRNRQPHGPMLGQDPARRAAATRQRIKTRSRQPEIRERKHGVDLRPFCQGCIIAMRGLRCSPAEIERNLLIPVRSLSNPYCIRPFLASHAWRYQK